MKFRKKHFLLSGVLFITVCFSVFSIVSAFTPQVEQEEEKQYFFTIHMIQRPPYRDEYGTLLQQWLDPIGIKLVPELLDAATEEQRYVEAAWYGKTYDEGGADMFSCGGITIPPDPSVGSYYQLWSDNGRRGIEYFKFNSRFYDSRLEGLVQSASQTLNMTLRQELYKKMTVLLQDDLPYIPLYSTQSAVLTTANVENWKPYVGLESIYWGLQMKDGSKEMIYGQPLDIMYLSGFFAGAEPGSQSILSLGYDTLVRYKEDGSGELVPHLAESWEISPDSLTITLKLVENAKWHDSHPFTAEDVKFTFEIQANPAAAAARPNNVENIESIETPNNYTVIINFKTVDAGALEKIGMLPICGKHLYEGVQPEDYRQSTENTERFIGTGPYKMGRWEKGQYFEMVRNPDYWGIQPNLDTIFIKIMPEKATAIAALKAGEADVLTQNYGFSVEADELKDNPDYNVLTFIGRGNQMIAINCQHPILQNNWVRKAISTVIPRTTICESIYKGWRIPATQYFTENAWVYNPDLPPLEGTVEQAKLYMEKAGFNYEWLEPPEEPPMTVWLYPLLGGLVAGAVVTGLVMTLISRRKI